MNNDFTYRIFPLGDSALTIDFGNTIDENINRKIISLFKVLQIDPLPGMIEAIPAYSSISILYNVIALKKNVPADKTVYEWIREKTEFFLRQHNQSDNSASAIIKIPVCYDEEFAPDMARIIKEKKISKEEVIQIHTGKQYRVYMLGFLPGFPYLGEIDEKIAMPRKPQPQSVAAGSVAIAGKQTGIYPLTSPGGWSVIGRTPIKLFDAEKEELTLLKAGNMVEFYSISKEEFLKMQS
jgi:inhibitor of KinA